jgi:CRISPR-associated protein (TIGR03986 family)
MVSFVRKRRNEDREELFEDFCDSFYLDGDDNDRELFRSAISRSTSTPNNQSAQNKQGHNRHHRSTGNARMYNPEGKNLAKAPYRFVALDNRVAQPEAEVKQHWSKNALLDVPIDNGICASLDIEWTFVTPVLIGEEDGDRDVPLTINEKPVIPGSTLRGLMRSIAEVLGHAKLTQVNLHHQYGFRDFTHREHAAADAKGRNEVLAGWLEYRETDEVGKSNFAISPAGKPIPIKIRQLNSGQQSDAEFRYNWLRNSMWKRYSTYGMTRGKTVDFKKKITVSEATGVLVVSDTSPTITNDRRKWLTKLEREDNGQGPGKGEQKKREHLFLEPQSAPVQLTHKQWDLFERINSKPSRNRPEPTGNWATLRTTLGIGEEDQTRRGRIPIFYVGEPGSDEKAFEFGLVRMFKRPHKKTVKDAIPPSHALSLADFEPDFVEALFGYVHEDENADNAQQLAGRIACGMAVCTTDPADIEQIPKSKPITAVLGAPRASYAPFYLQGQEKDWSSDHVRIAGRKRYPVRFANGADLPKLEKTINGLATPTDKRNREVESRMVFLAPKPGKSLQFSGQIKLHNVTRAELGLVIKTLLLGTDPDPKTWHLLGRAKMAGAGQCRVTRISGQIETIGGISSEVDWQRGKDLDDFKDHLDALSHHMRSEIPGWPDVPQVKELMAVSDPSNWHDKSDRLKYMILKDHNRLREIVKAHVRDAPPSDINEQHRALPGADA